MECACRLCWPVTDVTADLAGSDLAVRYSHVHTAKEISDQSRKFRNRIVVLKLTNTYVNLLNIKQN